jgi:hypothetical protein
LIFKRGRIVITLFAFLITLQVSAQKATKNISNKTVVKTVLTQPVDYVNPYTGNISHLLVPTYPTIHLPNSFLRVYPERSNYTGDLLKGLPLEVTSHRGSSAFNLSPFQGDEKAITLVIKYSYDQEKITP